MNDILKQENHELKNKINSLEEEIKELREIISKQHKEIIELQCSVKYQIRL